jgi:hypothetical protein
MQVGPPSRQSRAAANSEVPARTRHWSRRCLVRSRKAPGDPLYLSRSSRRHEHRCCWRGQPLWFCGGRGRGERFGDKGFVRIAMKRAQAPLQEITTAPRQVPEASDRADCLSKAPEQQPTFCALLPASKTAGAGDPLLAVAVVQSGRVVTIAVAECDRRPRRRIIWT